MCVCLCVCLCSWELDVSCYLLTLVLTTRWLAILVSSAVGVGVGEKEGCGWVAGKAAYRSPGARRGGRWTVGVCAHRSLLGWRAIQGIVILGYWNMWPLEYCDRSNKNKQKNNNQVKKVPQTSGNVCLYWTAPVALAIPSNRFYDFLTMTTFPETTTATVNTSSYPQIVAYTTVNTLLCTCKSLVLPQHSVVFCYFPLF